MHEGVYNSFITINYDFEFTRSLLNRGATSQKWVEHVPDIQLQLFITSSSLFVASDIVALLIWSMPCVNDKAKRCYRDQ